MAVATLPPPRERTAAAPAAPAAGGQAPARRPHLREIDMLRGVTALAVVAVHATFFTLNLNSTQQGVVVQNAAITLLHFTREIFISITALVLVYGYANRPFSPRTFWRKRGLGVLLPYAAWSFFYTWQNVPHTAFFPWLGNALLNIVSGSAEFQLYFILLSLEVYLVLPGLLWLMKRARKHPWRWLAGSFALQVVLLYLDFHFVEAGPFAATPLGVWINTYQSRFLPLYQFYVVIGALAALYLDKLRAFVLRRLDVVLAIGVLGIGVHLAHYFYTVVVQHQNIDYETTVFQPSMVVFAFGITLLLYGLSVHWASSAPRTGLPVGARFVSLLSDVSFGIYLIHPLLLFPILQWVTPHMPGVWPVALRVFLTWLAAVSATVLVTAVMLYTPLASRLVGRPYADGPVTRWVGRRWASLAGRGRSTSDGEDRRSHSSRTTEVHTSPGGSSPHSNSAAAAAESRAA